MSIIVITLIVLTIVTALVMLSKQNQPDDCFQSGNIVVTYNLTGNGDMPYKECSRFAIVERLGDRIAFKYSFDEHATVPIKSLLEAYDKVMVYDDQENHIKTFYRN